MIILLFLTLCWLFLAWLFLAWLWLALQWKEYFEQKRKKTWRRIDL